MLGTMIDWRLFLALSSISALLSATPHMPLTSTAYTLYFYPYIDKRKVHEKDKSRLKENKQQTRGKAKRVFERNGTAGPLVYSVG